MEERLRVYEPFWGEWYLEAELGAGGFGSVYRLCREEMGRIYYCALKHIKMPANEAAVRQAYEDGYDEAGMRRYFWQTVEEIYSEIELMAKFKGNSHIVSYEDSKIVERQDAFGWDILIRMEYLTNLNDRIAEKPFTRRDVAKLGIDICRALELCQSNDIIHRDIKPDNIFVSQAGDYKLGDFGIARKVDNGATGLSIKGTQSYMAPEVFKGQSYNASVDIYSLGLVLYRLLNDNRMPFLPAYPAPITTADRERALALHMGGTAYLAPTRGGGTLGEIAMKAASYKAADRYASPGEMRAALQALERAWESGEDTADLEENLMPPMPKVNRIKRIESFTTGSGQMQPGTGQMQPGTGSYSGSAGYAPGATGGYTGPQPGYSPNATGAYGNTGYPAYTGKSLEESANDLIESIKGSATVKKLGNWLKSTAYNGDDAYRPPGYGGQPQPGPVPPVQGGYAPQAQAAPQPTNTHQPQNGLYVKNAPPRRFEE